MSRSKVAIIILFLAAALLRFADVFRPINQASWRECDVGAIARNFAVEGMNPFYPRIDWRGDGPGYAEMELPLYPWLIAVSYKIFGVHDYFARVWAFLFSLGAMFFFFKLAREYLNAFAATVAFAFFALNPLMVETATSIQPEGLMIFAYIAAVYYFVNWLRTESNLSFVATTSFTALTLLAKAPSAHIGLFFAILLIEKYGWRVFRQMKVWIFGIFSLAPAGLWYIHAKNLWTVYGNSLGVSNEYHWIGWDFFTNSEFAVGILRSEFFYIWGGSGIIVGAFALWRGRGEETARHSLGWLASIFALYLIAARTTSQDWANYYHVFSIPPVALLVGFGIKKLWDYARTFADSYSLNTLAVNLGHVAILFFVVIAILAALAVEARQVRAEFLAHRVDDAAYECSQKLKLALKTEGLIVASGGHCVDKNNYALAYNASFMFYWLERKGWNICIEDQSIKNIAAVEAKGAKYFVAQRSALGEMPGFENELLQTYPVADACDQFYLFDLTHRR